MQINENTKVIKLAWPILIETMLFMLMGNIDTIMLSRFSDVSVAAVGTSNQVFNLVLLIFTIISSSTSILLAQFLGAGKRNEVDNLYTLSFTANALISVVSSLILTLFISNTLRLVNVPENVFPQALDYSRVIASFLFIASLNSLFNVIIRANGHTKPTMYFSLVANLVNIAGNYAFLYGPFGIPVLGVRGVAISTVVSRMINLALLYYYFRKNIPGCIDVRKLKDIPKSLMSKMVKVGIPSAGEPISWQFSQVVILAMINSLGSEIVTSKVYVSTISWFTFLVVIAISQATQIIVGHLVGMDKYDEASSLIKKYTWIGVASSVTVASIFALSGKYIIGIFTKNANIVAIAVKVLFIDIILEAGRAVNLVVINAMKAAGDYKFPTIVGLFSMWGISALFSYILGIRLGLGIYGIWVAMASDEIIRAVIMLIRWNKGTWKNKKLV